jgi:hypothetical protein
MPTPFQKHKETSVSVPSDHIRMGKDKDEEQDYEFDMLDAVAEDMLSAVERKDKRMLKAALQSLCDHLMMIDEDQDEKLMEDK